MTLIGLISDVHATPEPVAEALAIFSNAGVSHVFCAGDIAGYMDKLDETIKLLVENDCQTIMGNHDLLHIDHNEDDSADNVITFLKHLPATIETIIEGKSVYVVHAQPPDATKTHIMMRSLPLAGYSAAVQPLTLALSCWLVASLAILALAAHFHGAFDATPLIHHLAPKFLFAECSSECALLDDQHLLVKAASQEQAPQGALANPQGWTAE